MESRGREADRLYGTLFRYWEGTQKIDVCYSTGAAPMLTRALDVLFKMWLESFSLKPYCTGAC